MGVLKDEAEAVRWYRLAATQGVATAQFRVGVMYTEGRGVLKDEGEAARWFRLAAEQKLRSCAVRDIGDHVQPTARGVLELPGRDAEAVRWYRLAAEQGNSSAQYSLGNMYANGEGVLDRTPPKPCAGFV